MPFLSSLRISVASFMLQSPPTPTTPYHATPQHYTLPLSSGASVWSFCRTRPASQEGGSGARRDVRSGIEELTAMRPQIHFSASVTCSTRCNKLCRQRRKAVANAAHEPHLGNIIGIANTAVQVSHLRVLHKHFKLARRLDKRVGAGKCKMLVPAEALGFDSGGSNVMCRSGEEGGGAHSQAATCELCNSYSSPPPLSPAPRRDSIAPLTPPLPPIKNNS